MLAQILNSSDPKLQFSSNNYPSFPSRLNVNNYPRPPSLPSFPSFNSGQPPPSIANNPTLFPAQRPYFHPPTTNGGTTKLTKIDVETKAGNSPANNSKQPTLTSSESTVKPQKDENNGGSQNMDQAVKSVPDLTVTLVPIITVCAIFLAVGTIALVLRKKICFGQTKALKEDMVSIFGILFLIRFKY